LEQRKKYTGGPDKRKPEQILIKQSNQSRIEPTGFLRRALLEIGRECKCEICGQGELWNNNTLVLQIDHINGERRDNTPENLRFLCPNCHLQTPAFSQPKKIAGVLELADRHDLGSCAVRREGSSPSFRTKKPSGQ
jgi:HNH endonuclease